MLGFPDLVLLAYVLLTASALAISIGGVILYFAWRRERVFLVFGFYAFWAAVSEAVAYLIRIEPTSPPFYLLTIQVLGVLLLVPAFFEANRLVLRAPRNRVDRAALALHLLCWVPVLFVTLLGPSRINYAFLSDAWGQILWYLVPREVPFQELRFFLPVFGTVAWSLWVYSVVGRIRRASPRIEARMASAVLGALVVSFLNDSAVALGLYEGVFVSYFLFGFTATMASVWLLRQMIENSRALEDLTRTLEQRVSDRTMELKSANVHLAEVNALKNDFLAICSHDLKNLLVSVQGYAELMELSLDREPDIAKLRSYASEVRHSSQRMLDLIRDLLDVAKLESGRVDLQMAPSQVAVPVREAFTQYLREAEIKNVAYVLDVDDELPEIALDRSKLQQAVANLLHNALKFTPSGGRIDCRVRRSDGSALIEVSDTGPGIPSEDQVIVFDKFAIARKRRQERSKNLGTGLGLSITKTFAELHGGKVEIDSAIGRGTTFRIYLPIHDTVGEPT